MSFESALASVHTPTYMHHYIKHKQKLVNIIRPYLVITFCAFQWLLSWLVHKRREGYQLPTWGRKMTSASYFLSKLFFKLKLVTDNLLFVYIPWCFQIPYSGKFSRGPNFRDFRDPRPKRENKNREITAKNLNTWTFAWTFGLVEICARAFVHYSLARSDDGTALLFQTTPYHLLWEIFRPLLARLYMYFELITEFNAL